MVLPGCVDPGRARASHVRDHIAEQYGGEEWLVAVGIGTRNDDWVVSVTVRDMNELPEEFPERKAGVRIEVEEGELEPLES